MPEGNTRPCELHAQGFNPIHWRLGNVDVGAPDAADEPEGQSNCQVHA
jgi:hypothetical protein